MQEINIETWKRKEHFEFFKTVEQPQFNICFNVNITSLVDVVKSQKLPFYYSMIYFSLFCANQIDEFKYRLRDGKVVLHKTLHPSFTDMNKDSELFKIVLGNYQESLSDFVMDARQRSQNQVAYFPTKSEDQRDDLIYITSIPWFSFTQITHPLNSSPVESIPRLAWGRFFEQDQKIMLPYSIQLHHAFADAFHIAKFKDLLESLEP